MNHSESQKSSAPVATGDYLRCSTCGAETSLRALAMFIRREVRS